MKRTGTSVSAFFLMTGILFFTGACHRSTPPLVIPQLVKTTEVKPYDVSPAVTYPGKIQAAADVNLSFRVAGPIVKFYAKEGEFVRKGKVLAEIDPRDYQLKYDAALAEYNQVKEESERIMELYERHSVTLNDYDKAVAAWKQVTALYQANKNMLADTKLRAPFDGYIQHKYFDTHEIVNQGVPVLSMIDNDYLEVDIDIPSSDYIRRADFASFFCTVDVYPDTLLPLQFLEINQKANYNQLFKVRFRMKRNKALNLAPGMSVSATIQYKTGVADLAVIPISSLFRQDNNSYVWLYDQKNGVVKMRKVEVQQILKDGEVIVKSELLPGEVIVSAGVNQLKEGQSVRSLPAVPASNVGKLL